MLRGSNRDGHSGATPLAMLRDGRADVGLPHHPQNELRGLAIEALDVEPRVLALASHPLALAARDTVCLADLAGETMPHA